MKEMEKKQPEKNKQSSPDISDVGFWSLERRWAVSAIAVTL